MQADLVPAQSIAAAPSPSISAWKAVAILTATIAAMLLFRDLYMTRWSGDLSIGGFALWGRDFVNLYTSGSLVLQDRLDLLYTIEPYRAYQVELFDQGLKWHNYSYPPVTLLYTWLFALLPYPLALLVWLGSTGGFFAWAARPYVRSAGLPGWIAVATPAALINLWAGHYGFLIGGLWLAAWSFLPRRPVLSGILIGLMIVKPHLAVLAPLVLLYRREWTAIAAAAATVILLIALSVAVFGADLWITYLTETARLQAEMVDDVDSFFITMMPTLTPSLAIIGVPTAAATLAQLLAGLAAVAALLKWMPKDPQDAALATAVATFLVLPYAFAYDMTVVCLASLLLFRRALDEARPRWFSFGLAMATLLPMAIMYFNFFGYPVAPLLLALLLAAQLGWSPGLRRTA